MKVIVLGAGVIGTTSAYYLARAGAEVTVIDRQGCVANETSFANAGQISPGYSTPWAAPGIPFKAFKWMFTKHAPLAIKLDGSLWQLRWMANMLRNCTASRYELNKERMMRVAEYSRNCLDTLRADTGIQYEQRCGGTLQLFRTQAQLDAVQRDIKVLEECGVPYELLGVSQLTSVEPGLRRAQGLLAGGLRLAVGRWSTLGRCERPSGVGAAGEFGNHGVRRLIMQPLVDVDRCSDPAAAVEPGGLGLLHHAGAGGGEVQRSGLPDQLLAGFAAEVMPERMGPQHQRHIGGALEIGQPDHAVAAM